MLIRKAAAALRTLAAWTIAFSFAGGLGCVLSVSAVVGFVALLLE